MQTFGLVTDTEMSNPFKQSVFRVVLFTASLLKCEKKENAHPEHAELLPSDWNRSGECACGPHVLASPLSVCVRAVTGTLPSMVT